MQTVYKPAVSVRLSSRQDRATAALGSWTAWLDLCLARWRERRQLRELTDAQLKDIGLSPADVERECRRRPWDCLPRDF
jgi:uncharacterized protein YjiS (DUF1127 family)